MEYKWIAQDINGIIDLYVDKPKQSELCCWMGGLSIQVTKNPTRERVQHRLDIEIEDWESSLINLETHDYKIEDGVLKQVEKTQRCKYADVFIEAANDKTKVLQVKKGETWQDVPVGMHEYRIKPEKKVVLFRNYLNENGKVKVCKEEGEASLFVKWIGDWQHVEI